MRRSLWLFLIFHNFRSSLQKKEHTKIIWCRVLGPSAMRPLPIDESALNFSLPPYHCVAKRGDREKLLRTTLNSVKTKLLLYHRFFFVLRKQTSGEKVFRMYVCALQIMCCFFIYGMKCKKRWMLILREPQWERNKKTRTRKRVRKSFQFWCEKLFGSQIRDTR